jgi:hypothetical protein
MITNRKNTANARRFLDVVAEVELSRFSSLGQTVEIGSRIFGAKILIAMKKRLDAIISTKLTKSNGLSWPASLAFRMNTGPFSKTPATITVAPVSDRDRANARRNPATKAGFSKGSETVRTAVKVDAPRVRAAVS